VGALFRGARRIHIRIERASGRMMMMRMRMMMMMMIMISPFGQLGLWAPSS
jgi:hypothetical protein